MAHQHLIPQMMIRRFAGPDGKLSELHKPTLTLGTRRRSPKGILFAQDFYHDRLSDFDDELLKPIEQKFARFYPSLADNPRPEPLSGEGGAALIDWIAAMLIRTRAHVLLGQAAAKKIGGLPALVWALDSALLKNNIGRSLCFSEYQDLLSRPKVRWKIKTYPSNDVVVLTDFPVCQTNGIGAGGQVTVIPLSKHRVLFGGTQEAVDRCNIPVEDLNAFLSGCAEHSIFAADMNTLEVVAHMLRGDDEWCEAARKPFFGFADFLNDQENPSDTEVSRLWHDMKNSFGESILSVVRSK